MMEPGSWLLLGLLTTLVILIILQVKHSRKEREEREGRTSPATRTIAAGYSASPPAVKVRMSYSPRPVPAKAVPQRQAITPQVTLYQPPAVTGKLICPACEGENDMDHSFCLICGQRIR